MQQHRIPKIRSSTTTDLLIKGSTPIEKKLEIFLTSDGEHRVSKTKKKLFALENISEEQSLNIAGVCMCESIDIQKAVSFFKSDSMDSSLKGEILIVSITRDQSFIFLFEFGVVIFWNVSEEQQLATL